MFVPRNIEEISVEEKIQRFDKLYNSVLSAFEETINGNYSEDEEHYIFEEAMGWLGGREMWNEYNKGVR